MFAGRTGSLHSTSTLLLHFFSFTYVKSCYVTSGDLTLLLFNEFCPLISSKFGGLEIIGFTSVSALAITNKLRYSTTHTTALSDTSTKKVALEGIVRLRTVTCRALCLVHRRVVIRERRDAVPPSSGRLGTRMTTHLCEGYQLTVDLP